MTEQPLDYLKKLYEYEAWRGRNTLGEGLFIWQFSLSGGEVPGWQARHAQSIPPAGGFPPMIQSAWQPGRDDGGALLTVDVFECDSLEHAHEFLLQTLGQFQGPPLRRLSEGETGDVAFATEGETLILFARANLVLQIGSAGERPQVVTGVARGLDRELARKPEQEGRAVEGLEQLPSPGDKRDARILIDLREYERAERRPWYKFFARNGEVSVEDGLLLYRRTSEGPQELTVFEVSPVRGSERPGPPFNFR